MYAGAAPALAEREVAVDREDVEQPAVDEAGVDRQQPLREVDDADDVDPQLQDGRDAGARDPDDDDALRSGQLDEDPEVE